MMGGACGKLNSPKVLRTNDVGVRTHLSGLRALVKHAGGLENLSGAVIAPIML